MVPPALSASVAQNAVTVLWVLGGVAVVVGGYVLEQRRRRRKREGLARLLARDTTLQATAMPCGQTASTLAGTVATPRGDRRYGLRYAVSGPVEVTLNATTYQVECAAFQWWYEERRTTSNGRRSTRYVRRSDVVAAVRLPLHIEGSVDLVPESVLGRAGLTRGGHQFESSEFNRRFRVTSDDRTLAIQLLAPALQQRLVEEFAGRSLHLAGHLLLLGGAPTHRDGSLPGVIGQLPAVRQDLGRLIDAIPARFWRAGAAPERQASG